MEWHMMNAYGTHTFSENIGYYFDDAYIIADECEDTLLEILEQLNTEDPVTRQFRRQLALMEVIQRDLVPLLIHLDPTEDSNIFCTLLHVVANLTQPIECPQTSEDAGRKSLPKQSPKIQELTKLFDDAKKSFTDRTLVKALLTGIKSFRRKDDVLSETECIAVNHFLLIVRNLLYSSSSPSDDSTYALSVQQALLLRTFLTCGLGKTLISFLTHPQWDYWVVGAIQVLTMFYKSVSLEEDKKYGLCSSRSTISGKASNDFSMEEFYLDSAEESQHPETCVKYLWDGCDLDQEEERTGACENQETCEDASTQECLPELVSVIKLMETSLNLETCNVQRERTTSPEGRCGEALDNSTNFSEESTSEELKILQDEIRVILIEFTGEFLQKGFSQMVISLLNRLVCPQGPVLQECNMYFLWMIAFFLMFARKNKVEFQCLRGVFVCEVIGMIAYEGLRCWEEILLAQKEEEECDPNATKRLHLVVTSFKEILKTLHAYSNEDKLSEEDILVINMIKYNMVNMKELRQFFLLSIRYYQSDALSEDFLYDVVLTNHKLLNQLDNSVQEGVTNNSFNILDHVKQFGTTEIIGNYGRLLGNYMTNGNGVNDCIFTMMHHVAGDCGKPESLLQDHILQTFIKIWDNHWPITEDVNDLMEYIVKTFIQSAEGNPMMMAQKLYSNAESEAISLEEESTFTQEEEDLVMSFYVEAEEEENAAVTISQKLAEEGIEKTPAEVSGLLCRMGLINSDDILEDQENWGGGHPAISDHTANMEVGASFICESKETNMILGLDVSEADDIFIPKCVEIIQNKGLESGLGWIQNSLLEVCYSKLVISGLKKNYPAHQWEPISFFSSVQGRDVPLYPFTEDQEQVLQDVHVKLTLQTMGFNMSKDTGSLFHSIPSSWSPDDLVDKAKQLGQLSYEHMKFTLAEMNEVLSTKPEQMTDITGADDLDMDSSSLNNYSSIPKALWPAIVRQLNSQLQET